jgi:cysteine synthase
MAVFPSVPGRTPLVPLPALSPRPGITLLAKLEWHNPTGSVKDRPAHWMLEVAERDGLVGPGDALIEPTSGNTGIALARLARLRGYPMTVVPANVGEERKALLRAFGAVVVESPAERGANGAAEVASDIASGGHHKMLFQYANPANPQAHYEGTGPEILEQAGRVDAFIAGLGTGGTLMGVGRALREADPSTRVVAAAPPTGESVLGLRSLEDGFVPPIFDPAALDARILVSTADAVRAVRRLLAEEGLFVGLSSGAVLHAALRWAERVEEGRLVLLFADAGWKYLASGAWEGTVEEAAARLNRKAQW